MARAAGMAAAALLLVGPPAAAQTLPPDSALRYVYDEAGRLKAVFDPATETATYRWDAVGNLLSIERRSSSAVSVLQLTPSRAPTGATVSVHGSGFSTTSSQNTVTFNGAAATVVSATRTELVVEVPASATSGPVTVTSPSGTATSDGPFTVTEPTPPSISGITPDIAMVGEQVSVQGARFADSRTENAVRVNQTRAAVASADPSALSVEVPDATASGRVGVSTVNGSATGPYLYIPPPGYTTSDVEVKDQIALDQPKLVRITGAGKIALLVFDATAGDRLALTTSGATMQGSVRVLQPNGRDLASVSISPTAPQFMDTQTLPLTGTYTLLVDPNATATGNVTIKAIDVPEDAGGVFEPTAEGHHKVVTTTVPGQNVRGTFEAEAGERIFVWALGNSSSEVRLLQPNGAALGSRQWVYNSQIWVIDTVAVPETGTYSVTIDPPGQWTGSHELRIFSVPADHTGELVPSAAGDSRQLTFAAGQNARYTFQGTAGQRVSAVATNSTTSGSMQVLRPDASELSSASINASGGFIDATSLPSSGTYTLVVDPKYNLGGGVTVTLHDVPTDAGGVFEPTAEGHHKTVPTTVPGQNIRASFEAEAGERIFVWALGTYSSEVRLIQPNGSQLGSRQSVYNSQIDVIDTVAVPESGTYTVTIDPSGTWTGSHELRIFSVPADHTGELVPSAAGDSRTLTFASGQNARYTFQGTAGQRVSAVATNSTTSGSLQLVRPDGSQLSSKSINSSGGFIDAISLPSSGTYTLVVDPSYNLGGGVTVSLHDVPGDAGGLFEPDADGHYQAVTTTVPGQNIVASLEAEAGERIFVRVGGPYRTSARLRKSNWQQVASPSTNADPLYIDTVAVAEAGTYLVTIDPSGAWVGSHDVTIFSVPADHTGELVPSAAGDSRQPSFSVGQNARYSFQGTAGQRVSAVVSNTTANGDIRLLRPDGSELRNASFSASGGYLDATSLPSSGTYTLVLDPRYDQGGSLTVSLHDVPGDAGGVFEPTADGHYESVTTTVPGQNITASFAADAGERIFVRMSGPHRLTARLRKSNGQQIAAWSTNADPSFIDTVAVPETGTYLVTMDPSGAWVGSHGLTIFSVPADHTGELVPTAAGDSRQPSFSAGQNARYTFQGTAGQRVSAAVTNAPHTGTIRLLRPDGSQLASRSYGGTASGVINETTLPSAGTYTLVVDPSYDGTGSLTVTLYHHGQALAPLAPPDTIFASYSASRPATGARPAAYYPPTGARRVASATPDRQGLRSFLQEIASALREVRATARRASPRAMRSPAATRAPRAHRAPLQRASRSRSRARDRRASPARVTRKRSALTDPVVRNYRPSQRPRWTPGPSDRSGAWTTAREDSPWEDLPALTAPEGDTAVSGQVLKLNGMPLEGVKVRIEGAPGRAVTGRSGRFLLPVADPGSHVLVIEHSSRRGPRYGTYDIKVDARAGETTELDQPVWLTPLDPRGDFRVPARTTKPLVLTNPHIPGFEIRIPAGSQIRDREGRPVRRLNLSAVPLDRTPFPLPHFDVPAYFTIQPGGATLSKGAQVRYPNYMQLAPQQRVEFWNYDADDRGWYVYGHGRVSRDGTQMVPDPGVRIWELTGAMLGNGTGPPSINPTVGGGASGGDPVDLGTGLFVYEKTDLVVPDIISASVKRTYRPADANSYAFGRGTTSLYDIRLWSERNGDAPQLVMPDGGVVRFQRTNPEAQFNEGIYESVGTPGRFHDAVVRRNAATNGFDLHLSDGSVWVFGNYSYILAVRDRLGNQLTITRDNGDRGRVRQVTTPNGRWIHFRYDDSNRVIRATDNGGRTTTYTYDASNRLATATDANGGTTTFTYDAQHQMTGITDARDITYLTNTYDPNGRVMEQRLADDGLYRFSYEVDGSGRVTKTRLTDPRNVVREVTFNAAGYSVSATAAAGHALEQTLAIEREPESNQVLSTTDELGRKTSVQYDAAGNVTEVTELDGTASARTARFTYEPTHNRLMSVTDPLNHTTSYGRDSHGRLTSVRDATQREVTFGYEGQDPRPVSITDPLGKTTRLAYEAGDLVAVRDPLGRETRYQLDSVGRRIAVIDPLRGRSHYRYDDLNQLVKLTAPDRSETSLEYDPNGNLIEVRDARGQSWTGSYDAMDRLSSWTDPLLNEDAYEYDLHGNLTSWTDRRGEVTTYRYDALDRRTFAGFGATGPPASPSYESQISYGYDSANRLTSANDSTSGDLTMTYDQFDRLSSESGPVGTVSYTYDAADRRTTMTVPGQPPATYSYDDANRLLGLSRGGLSVSLAYDGAGRRQSVTLPNGITQEYTHDDASQLTGISYKRSGGELGDLRYAYDVAGRRTAVWGSYARTGLPAAMGSATYDAANRRVSQDGQALSHDAAGNLTEDAASPRNTYSWNARGQLESISGGQSATFDYDPFGRRQRKTVAGVTTDFLYDGRNVVQERSGGAATAELLTGLWLDETFGRTTVTGTHSYLTDAIGSTVALSDALGVLSTSYTYEPFGEASAAGPTSENPYQFTGRENDGTGLYYYRARYYSPSMQRFISEDPIGMAGGDVNVYAYAFNNPMAWTDPTGLNVLDDIGNAAEDTADWAVRAGENVANGVDDWCELNCEDLVSGTKRFINLPDRLYWWWDCSYGVSGGSLDECDPVELLLGDDSVEATAKWDECIWPECDGGGGPGGGGPGGGGPGGGGPGGGGPGGGGPGGGGPGGGGPGGGGPGGGGPGGGGPGGGGPGGEGSGGGWLGGGGPGGGGWLGGGLGGRK